MDPYDRTMYCKLFMNTDEPIDALTERVHAAVGGNARRRRIETDQAILDVRKNDDFDPTVEGVETRWKYYLDIDMRVGGDKEAYILSIARLIRTLRDTGIDAVAASDFEDELV
jgi:hypothetical protein